jgi:hypothetical protein
VGKSSFLITELGIRGIAVIRNASKPGRIVGKGNRWQKMLLTGIIRNGVGSDGRQLIRDI